MFSINKFKQIFTSVRQANYMVNMFLKLNNKKKYSNLFFKIIKFTIRNRLHSKFNIILGDECIIDDKLFFPHPQNIVIGSRVMMGKNCIIYHDVTIGQNKGKYPSIGDNVIIYPGAKIIGNIKIGSNVIIGANSVVIKNVPDDTIVAGIPAEIISKRVKNDEFY